ncbi:MAG: response regulator [Gammaproteobacteria bacterium]
MFCALLVDANLDFRQALADMLCLHFPFMNVEEAGEELEALSKVEYLRPNIIFTDIDSQAESGLELAREIKRVYGNLVTGILTSDNLPELRPQSLQTGVDCCISKNDGACIKEIATQIEVAINRTNHAATKADYGQTWLRTL